MSHSPLKLELGPGFAEEMSGCADELLLWTRAEPGASQAEVVTASPALAPQRVLGRLPGRFIGVGTIAAARLRKKAYVAGEDGIWEFPLEGGEPALVAGLPDLPAASKAEIQAAFGANAHNEHWVPHKTRRPSYHWAFAIDASEQSLFATKETTSWSPLPYVVALHLLNSSRPPSTWRRGPTR